MNTIRYNLIGAHESGIMIHPQTQVENLGMKVISFEGCEIADCVFMSVEKVPENLPDYIEISDYEMIK